MLLGSLFIEFGVSGVPVPVFGGSGVPIPGIAAFGVDVPVFGGL